MILDGKAAAATIREELTERTIAGDTAGHVAPEIGGPGPRTRAGLLLDVVLAAERAAAPGSRPA